jgi:hypothetical protein
MALKESSHFALRVILHSLAGVELAAANIADGQCYGREFEDAESATGHGTSCHNARVTAGYQQLSIMSFAFKNSRSTGHLPRQKRALCYLCRKPNNRPSHKTRAHGLSSVFASREQIERALNLSTQDLGSYTDVRI